MLNKQIYLFTKQILQSIPNEKDIIYVVLGVRSLLERHRSLHDFCFISETSTHPEYRSIKYLKLYYNQLHPVDRQDSQTSKVIEAILGLQI